MSITVNEQPTSRRSNSQWSENGTIERTHTRVFFVESTTAISTYDAQTAAGVPSIGDAHNSDTSAYCVSLNCEPADGFTKFFVTANYSSEFDEAQENPLDRTDEVRWGGTDRTERVWFDANDDPIVNSANQFIDYNITKEVSEPSVTVTRNESGVVVSDLISFANTVNNSDFTIGTATIPSGTAKMGTIHADKQYEGSYEYWRVSYPMKLRENGWRNYVPDVGYFELTTSSGLQPILDDTGQRVFTPQALEADGSAKPFGSKPDYYIYYVYKETDFTSLNF